MIQNWILSKRFDLTWILAPMLVPALLVVLFPSVFQSMREIPLAFWLIVVVGVDVSHVYATLFRTYLDSEMRIRHRQILRIAPVIALVLSVVVLQISFFWFWRLLAYLAVFHFVRQQYGFMKIYERDEPFSKAGRWISALAIYAGTLFPVLIWHMEGRQFNWFVENDFFRIPATAQTPAFVLFGLIQLLYIGKEIYFAAILHQPVSLPKNLVWFSTCVTWYVGIVWLDSDASFTLTNVLAHGIPYMALVFATTRKRKPTAFPWYWFAVVLLVLAVLEETLWDRLVWHESDHAPLFSFLPEMELTSPLWMAVVAGFLSTPQITHYILDGYIWKRPKSAEPALGVHGNQIPEK